MQKAIDSNPLVILVDEHDNQTGVIDKLSAHQKGLLHRAFSIFIFNSKGEILLQKRSSGKYHSPGLWTNTCCSHPLPQEDILSAANRRLKEEMGMKCELKTVFSFIYHVQLDQGMTEHEFDHVLIGYADIKPILNLEEAEDYKYVSTQQVIQDILNNPNDFTEWFKIAINKLTNYLELK